MPPSEQCHCASTLRCARLKSGGHCEHYVRLLMLQSSQYDEQRYMSRDKEDIPVSPKSIHLSSHTNGNQGPALIFGGLPSMQACTLKENRLWRIYLVRAVRLRYRKQIDSLSIARPLGFGHQLLVTRDGVSGD
jgi:hypothetical protein